MDALKTTVAWVKIDSTFIRLLQVMANMQERCTPESVTEMSLLAVGSNKSCEPIICKANGWNFTSIAAVLQACLTEARDHLSCEYRSIVWVWAWEDVRMMKEYKMHTVYHTFMDTHLDTTVNIDKQIVLMVDSILMQVVSLAFLISVIVRRDDDDLLSEVSQTNR